MKFFLACLVWIGIAFVLGLGIWMFAVKGAAWLLVLSAVALLGAIWKIGCAAH